MPLIHRGAAVSDSSPMEAPPQRGKRRRGPTVSFVHPVHHAPRESEGSVDKVHGGPRWKPVDRACAFTVNRA